MIINKYKITAILLLCFLGGCEEIEEKIYLENSFVSASSVEEVKEQFNRLPNDDIWWTKNGSDMAWNFKNLHRIFPTVNVYRNGPVRELKLKPSQEISSYPVNTASGKMSFSDYLKSSESTAMGVVISHRGEIIFESYPRMEEYEKPIYWSVAKILPAK